MCQIAIDTRQAAKAILTTPRKRKNIGVGLSEHEVKIQETNILRSYRK